MNGGVQLRKIERGDYKFITELTNQLGSNVPSDIVCEQIEEIAGNPNHFAFVAAVNNNIVGYIHCFKSIRLTTKPFIEICGLIVHNKERRNGIGKLLVNKVEELSKDIGKIRVRCNSKREVAHKFYYELGYLLKKEQKIFEKKL